MSELEGYFKRMVMNAKEYYNKGSDIFEDAERVRKALSNYMTKTNPAYKRETGYSCTAAPVPGEEDDEGKDASQNGTKMSSSNGSTNGSVKSSRKRESLSSQDSRGEDNEGEDDDHDGSGDDDNENPRRIVIKRRESGRPATARSTASPAPTFKPSRGGRRKADHEYGNVSYKGLTFQQAQEKIVEELIRKPDGSYVEPPSHTRPTLSTPLY